MCFSMNIRKILQMSARSQISSADISVEDLAVAIIDELEENRFIKGRFTAGY